MDERKSENEKGVFTKEDVEVIVNAVKANAISPVKVVLSIIIIAIVLAGVAIGGYVWLDNQFDSINKEISYIQGRMNIPHGSKTAFGKVNSIDLEKGILVIQETSGKNIELKLGKEIGVAIQTTQGTSPSSLHNVTPEASIRVDFTEDPQTLIKEVEAILIYRK